MYILKCYNHFDSYIVCKSSLGAGARSVPIGMSLSPLLFHPHSSGEASVPFHCWIWQYARNEWYLAAADVGGNDWGCTWVELLNLVFHPVSHYISWLMHFHLQLQCHWWLQMLSWITSLAHWSMSAEINYIMQQLTGVQFNSGEQNKDMSKARQDRDWKDTNTVTGCLLDRNPFSSECTLRNMWATALEAYIDSSTCSNPDPEIMCPMHPKKLISVWKPPKRRISCTPNIEIK